MKHLLLKIKDKKKLPFLRELLAQMDFVEVIEPEKFKLKNKKEIISIDENVNVYKKGKVKLKTLQKVLDGF